MYIKNSIKLGVSVDMAFDFLAEFENIPLWNYYVTEVRKDKNEEDELYHQIRRTDQQSFKVVEKSKPNRIKIQTINKKGIQFSRIFEIREINENGCILDDHFEMDLGKPQFIQKIFKPQIKNGVKKNLLKLKQLLEQGSTVLQDGRQSYLKTT